MYLVLRVLHTVDLHVTIFYIKVSYGFNIHRSDAITQCGSRRKYLHRLYIYRYYIHTSDASRTRSIVTLTEERYRAKTTDVDETVYYRQEEPVINIRGKWSN